MAKASKRKRSQRRDKKRWGKKPLEDEEIELEDETELKTRKRSQAAIKYRMSQKKKDKIVLAVAVILIIIILSVFYYVEYYSAPEDSDDGDNDENGSGPGNYSGSINIISHVTHQYGKNSWHLIDINGFTSYLIKVENTGNKEDTYKLIINNLDPRISINLDDNNFKLKPTKSKVVIAKVTTTIDKEYRLPTPIEIDLVSEFSKSVLDTVEIDLTVKQLDDSEVILSGDKVSAYYSGAYGSNGTLFDYSLKDPEMKDPLYISLTDNVQTDNFESRQYTPVIVGFKNGIIGMVPGETHVIEVPPELGYPTGHFLGGQTLIFEVYVISNDREL
ncbi:FKBP-type peptidyl-prolyl cis-trans isomerase [[Eubacterium] cellulosolvens]